MPSIRKLTSQDIDDIFDYLKINLDEETSSLFKQKLLNSQSSSDDLAIFQNFPAQVIESYMANHHQQAWMNFAETKFKRELGELVIQERNIHRNLPLADREAKVAIAKQHYLSNAYKQHLKKLNEEDPKALEEKQQLFLEYAAKEAQGPTPDYETIWFKTSKERYATDLEILAKKLQHDNREAGLPITPDGPEMARKIEKAQNKYLNRCYKDHLKGIKKKLPSDIRLQTAINNEQKAFEASKPCVKTFLQREKNKYQAQVRALAKLHVVIERLEGKTNCRNVDLKRWAKYLTDAEIKHKNNLYKKIYKNYQHVNTASMVEDKGNVAALLLSGISLAFSAVAMAMSPHTSSIDIEKDVGGVISAVKSYEDQGVSMIGGIIDLLKGEKKSSFFKLSTTGLKFAATTADIISKYGNNFLHVLGSTTASSVVSTALLNVSAVYFQMQYNQSSRRLNIVEDELLTFDNLIHHNNTFNQSLPEIKANLTDIEKKNLKTQLSDIKLRIIETHEKVLTPLIRRQEKLKTELSELKAKVKVEPTPPQQLLHSIISTENALNQVSERIDNLEKHQQLEFKQVDIITQSIPPREKDLSDLQEELKQAKTELSTSIEKIMPELKEDREALHTIVKTELDINVMAKKKRDSAVRSVAMGAAMIAVAGIGLAAGLSTGVLPAAMLISSATVLTYKVAKAIRNKIKATKKSMAKIEATKGAEQLLENASVLESKTGINLTQPVQISKGGPSISLDKYINTQLIKNPKKARAIIQTLDKFQKEPNKQNLYDLKEAMCKRQHSWDIYHKSDGEKLYKALKSNFKMGEKIENGIQERISAVFQ